MSPGPAGGLRDRIEGVLLGAACGDALGVPYEFGSAPLAPGEAPRMIGGGLGPYAPGEWSDDTQMAAVVAQVAARTGLADEAALDAVVDGWVGWLRDGASDVGNQTRSVLGEVAADRGAPHAGERARLTSYALHAQTGHTAGNGSLMRTAPVALAFLDDPAALAERARTISSLTHADPLAGDACVLWCLAIRRAVLDGRMPDLGALVDDLPVERREQWTDWISDAERRPPGDFSPNGFVVTALQAAWSAIRHPAGDGSPAVASLGAAVHAGNDTDTVAAIAGGLLGAVHGASSLPEEWLEAVHGWPGLRADDLRDLARRIARDAVVPSGVEELDEVAEHLRARGLGEGTDFHVAGRELATLLSSERIHLARAGDGTYRVWYVGDRGAERTLAESSEWAVARQAFVDEAVRLARGRWGKAILDEPGPRRRWWHR